MKHKTLLLDQRNGKVKLLILEILGKYWKLQKKSSSKPGCSMANSITANYYKSACEKQGLLWSLSSWRYTGSPADYKNLLCLPATDGGSPLELPVPRHCSHADRVKTGKDLAFHFHQLRHTTTNNLLEVTTRYTRLLEPLMSVPWAANEYCGISTEKADRSSARTSCQSSEANASKSNWFTRQLLAPLMR